MKRFLYTLLFSTIFFFGMGMDSTISYAEETETKELIATSGQCGENVYWKIEGTTLTIYGTGDMYDYAGDWYNTDNWPDYLKVRATTTDSSGETEQKIVLANSLINKVIIKDGVTNIGEYALYNLGNDATEIQIGKSVTSINEDGCRGFNGKSIAIPGNVRELGIEAFACSSLESVTLEEGVQILNIGVFEHCEKLKEILWADSIRTVGYNAFSNTEWLQNQVNADGFVIQGNMLLGYYGEDTEVTIPDGITSIQGDGFRRGGPSGIEVVTIPDSVTKIGDYAFENTRISDLQLSDRIEYIGTGAFRGCEKWLNVRIPKNVKYIGNAAFAGSAINESKGRIYEVDADNTVYYVPDGCNVICEKEDKKVIAGSSSSKIPDGTKEIAEWAFANWKIEEIEFSNSLEKIGAYAFCSAGLKKIDLPEKVTRIEEWTFGYCPLETVHMSSVVSYIGNAAFYRANITTLDFLPDTVHYIGTGAFERCEQLTEVKLPKNLTYIGAYAFEYCEKLTDVKLPQSLTYIGESAFSSCNLNEVTIPGKVETIERFAFSFNDNLTKVEFLNFGAIKELSQYDRKFQDCPKIEKIICYQCDFGKWKYGHIYSYQNSNDNVIHMDDVNTNDFDWHTLFDRVWNGMSNSTNPYEIHLYAQSKEEVLAGNTQKPELPDNESGTTRQDNNTTATEKTTEKTTEAVTGQTKNSPQITCSKLIKVKLKNLKKHSKKISLRARTTSDGKLQYKITKYPKGAKKYISVNKKGMVTMKKGAKKGNYVVTITSPETQVYTKMSKNVTIRVK